MVSHSWRRATGSIPVVGSSRKTMGGSPTNATAVLNFRLLPPLYFGYRKKKKRKEKGRKEKKIK